MLIHRLFLVAIALSLALLAGCNGPAANRTSNMLPDFANPLVTVEIFPHYKQKERYEIAEGGQSRRYLEGEPMAVRLLSKSELEELTALLKTNMMRDDSVIFPHITLYKLTDRVVTPDKRVTFAMATDESSTPFQVIEFMREKFPPLEVRSAIPAATQPAAVVTTPLIIVERSPGYEARPVPRERYEIDETGEAKRYLGIGLQEVRRLSKMELEELLALVKTNKDRGYSRRGTDLPSYILQDRVLSSDEVITVAKMPYEDSTPYLVLEFMRKKFAPLEERDANSAASQPAFGRYSRSEFPNSEISFLIKEKPITGTPIDPERIVRSEIAWKFFAPQLPDHIVFSPEPTTQPIEKPLIAVELIPGYVNHPPPHERYEIGEDGKAKHCVSGEPDETLQLSKSELDELIAIVKNNESRGDVSTTVDMPCYVLSDRVVTVEYLSTAADTDAGVEKSAPFKVLEFMRKKFAETEE